MLYYKCVKDGKVVGTTASQLPVHLKSFVSISEAEYRTLSGIGYAESPTAEEIKTERSTAIKAACAMAIIGGFDADVLGRGNLHYTLTEIQQRDLQTQYAAIQAGASEALWHDASRVTHETYTAAQFTALFQAGYAYIISCKIRSDWLEQLAHDLADAGNLTEAAAADWATTLPESYQAQCNAQIAEMLGGSSNGTTA